MNVFRLGMLSESEFEDDPSNHVTLPQKLVSRGNIESGKSSIKLSELGPRLTLQLVKIEDGLLDGEVLYHDFFEKTDEEKLQIQKKREAKKKLKETRKKIQEKNKEKKENMKKELKEKSLEGMKKMEVEDNDAEYYKEEVGEEPDKDLFTQSQPKFSRPVQFQRKRKADKPTNNPPRKKAFKKGTRNLHNRDQRPIGGKQVKRKNKK